MDHISIFYISIKQIDVDLSVYCFSSSTFDFVLKKNLKQDYL